MFGGTFDPVHAAHLRMAQAFFDECQLDELRLIPAGIPYHRTQGPQASNTQRRDMLQLALADRPGWQVDERELTRERPAYTIETLEEIRAEIGPAAELWFLIGGDSLQNLHTWHRWQDLFSLANLAVAIRPGFVADPPDPALATRWQAAQVADFSKRTACGTIRPLALPPIPLSATDIRQQLATGQDCSAVLTPAVLAYIRQHGLYR